MLTDTLHKPGFRLQSLILAKLFSILETGTITVPLWVNAVRTQDATDATAGATAHHSGNRVQFDPSADPSCVLCFLF